MANDLELFARNLSTKLLTYATGRTMEVSDRPVIDRIVKEGYSTRKWSERSSNTSGAKRDLFA